MKKPQIWDVLAHADCQNEEPQMFRRFARKTLRYLADFEQIKGVLPHAGQGALCAPENRERRTERAGPKGQTFHGHGTPLWGDGRSAVQNGISRRPK